MGDICGKVDDLRKEVELMKGQPPETHFEDDIYPSNSFLIPEQVPVPSRFNGEDTNYSVENFKFAVEMWFSCRQSTVGMLDYDKITWVGNLLGGNPAKWWSSIANLRMDQAPLHRTNLESFWSQLRSCFGRRKFPFEEELEFLALSQGETDIAEFNSKFRQLAACVDWSRERLESALYLSKLNPTFIRHLKSTPPMPKDIELLMDSTSLFDPSFLVSNKQPVGRFPHPQKMVVAKPERVCFGCNQPGHIRPFCPLQRNKPRFTPSNSPGALGPGKGPATRQ